MAARGQSGAEREGGLGQTTHDRIFAKMSNMMAVRRGEARFRRRWSWSWSWSCNASVGVGWSGYVAAIVEAMCGKGSDGGVFVWTVGLKVTGLRGSSG